MNEKPADEGQLALASSSSTKVSLRDVRNGKAGLTVRRQKMLELLPKSGQFANFPHDSLKLRDLAYLSAKTGDEFALLRGKKEDILFRGTKTRCTFTGIIQEMLIEHKLELVGHSHPGEDEPEASPEDRAVLRLIGQQRSYVVSGRTGIVNDYTDDPFEVKGGGFDADL